MAIHMPIFRWYATYVLSDPRSTESYPYHQIFGLLQCDLLGATFEDSSEATTGPEWNDYVTE